MLKKIKDFKEKSAFKKLNAELSLAPKRQKEINNFKTARTAGIVFHVTQAATLFSVRKLDEFISQQGIHVEVLGMLSNLKLVDQYLYRKGYKFFTKEDLNWWGKPQNEVVAKFIHTPFDLLLDLSIENYFPIQYVTALSQAKFIIGRKTALPFSPDLAIDMDQEDKYRKEVEAEIKKSKNKNGLAKSKLETEVDKKVELEMRLNFLIEQIKHYLSAIEIDKS